MLAERRGAVIRYIPLNEDEQWDMDAYANLLSPKTRIVSLGHVSNALGLVNPVQQAIAMAKANRSDTLAIVDGAQSITHMPINVQELGCDFFAFSGHKLYAPTGTGGLWGRYELLDMLPPWMGGGEMIQEVTFEKTTYNKPPFKYEAGTPNIEGAIAMAQAMDFVNSVGFDDIEAHEHELMTLALDGLSSMPKVRILGKNAPRGAVISILVDGIHHYDLGTLVDQMGVAVRTGHHCCQPLMSVLGTTGTLRISFALYNTKEEVAVALKALDSAISMLS
jgi:cysteine desulfurase/selenocysteine lyase